MTAARIGRSQWARAERTRVRGVFGGRRSVGVVHDLAPRARATNIRGSLQGRRMQIAAPAPRAPPARVARARASTEPAASCGESLRRYRRPAEASAATDASSRTLERRGSSQDHSRASRPATDSLSAGRKLAQGCFPLGSVFAAPNIRAMQIISELETLSALRNGEAETERRAVPGSRGGSRADGARGTGTRGSRHSVRRADSLSSGRARAGSGWRTDGFGCLLAVDPAGLGGGEEGDCRRCPSRRPRTGWTGSGGRTRTFPFGRSRTRRPSPSARRHGVDGDSMLTELSAERASEGQHAAR
jgi:hypothetical protein